MGRVVNPSYTPPTIPIEFSRLGLFLEIWFDVYSTIGL
jgi:hypothetical protein